MAGISSIGTKFYYGDGTDMETVPVSYTELKGVQSIPELGATPEKIDTTTLADKYKTSVNGVQDLGELSFQFIYTKEYFKAASTACAAAGASKVRWFKVEFPDGLKFEFPATASIIMGGTEVNGTITFSLSLALGGNMKITEAGGGE